MLQLTNVFSWTLAYVALLALLLDRVLGDPKWIPHPVIAIGKWIHWLDASFNRAPHDRAANRWLGVLAALLTTGLSFIVPFILLALLQRVSPPMAMIVNILLVATTIAWRGLIDAGRKVHAALTIGGLEAGRSQVAMIVGRDTANLTEAEVVRATVETLAENIVDAIVSPVFFAVIGGAPLALLYRATNTLDSMMGYKNDRYCNFGWASARLDDVLNYIPARLTACILFVAIALAGLDVRGAWTSLRKDAHKHPSPNSGIPESLVAGGLGVQLGGLNTYGGVPSARALMGEAKRSLTPQDIVRTVRVVDIAAWLLVGVTMVMVMLEVWLLRR